jgi:hypothetical protein
MAPLGYIETIDAKGQVVARVRIESLPIHIGRAYSNDMVIDDPYVCPQHLIIERDQQDHLIARDLNSVNGLYGATDGKRVASLELASGSRFRIGRTLVRYRSVDHPLAPTLIDREIDASRLASPYVAAFTGLLVFLLLCLDSFLGTFERVTVAKVVSEPLTTFSMLLIWSGLWSLASRIVVSRLHFFEHATIAGCAIVSFFTLSALAEWTEFFFPIIPVLWIAGLVGTGIILAALVYNHLRFASTMRRRSRLWTALAVSTAMVGVSVISDYAGRSKFSNVMEFTGIVKPIDARLVPAISIDRFIDNNQKLRTDLDVLAQQARPTQP